MAKRAMVMARTGKGISTTGANATTVGNVAATFTLAAAVALAAATVRDVAAAIAVAAATASNAATVPKAATAPNLTTAPNAATVPIANANSRRVGGLSLDLPPADRRVCPFRSLDSRQRKLKDTRLQPMRSRNSCPTLTLPSCSFTNRRRCRIDGTGIPCGKTALFHISLDCFRTLIARRVRGAHLTVSFAVAAKPFQIPQMPSAAEQRL